MIGALMILGAMSCPARAQQGGADWDARIIHSSGSVTVLLASEGALKPFLAEDGLPLSPGDSVKTGHDGSALLTLSGVHSITLLRDSKIKISSVAKSETLLDLAFGRMLAFISPLVEGQKLSVETPQAVAAVRGTEFGVDAAASGSSVGVFDEGHVDVFNPAGKVMIGPNQETSIAPGRPPREPRALTNRFLRYRPFLKRLREQWRQLRRAWPRYAKLDRRVLRRRFMATRRRRPLLRGRRPAFGLPRKDRASGRGGRRRGRP